jgi:hypothetical protein
MKMAVDSNRVRHGLMAKHRAVLVTRQGRQKIAAINMYRRSQHGGMRCSSPADCVHTHTHTHTTFLWGYEDTVSWKHEPK